MARRSEHSRDELKALILDAAWDIVGSEGGEGLSARRIAKDIGYAPGTIYNLYKSMDDLVLHVNAKTLDLLGDVLNSDVCNKEGVSAEGNMKTMARLYMDFANDYHTYWLMLFTYQLPEERKSVGWYQEKVDGLFKPLECLVLPFYNDVNEGKKAAKVLWASIHGLCFLQETRKIPVMSGGEGVFEMSDYLIDTFVKGLKVH